MHFKRKVSSANEVSLSLCSPFSEFVWKFCPWDQWLMFYAFNFKVYLRIRINKRSNIHAIPQFKKNIWLCRDTDPLDAGYTFYPPPLIIWCLSLILPPLHPPPQKIETSTVLNSLGVFSRSQPPNWCIRKNVL